MACDEATKADGGRSGRTTRRSGSVLVEQTSRRTTRSMVSKGLQEAAGNVELDPPATASKGRRRKKVATGDASPAVQPEEGSKYSDDEVRPKAVNLDSLGSVRKSKKKVAAEQLEAASRDCDEAAHPEAVDLGTPGRPRELAKDISHEPKAGRGLSAVGPSSPRRTRSMGIRDTYATASNVDALAKSSRPRTRENPEEAIQLEDDCDESVRVIRSVRSTDANAASNPEGGRQLPGLPRCLDGEPPECSQWRAKAFDDVWTCLEAHIQYAQEEQNKSVFDAIQHWIWSIHSSNEQSRLFGSSTSVTGGQTMTSPSTPGVVNKQLNTGLLYLGGVDPSDQSGTFDELASQLRGAKCHVAALTPSDQGGLALPLRSLLKQLVSIDPETTDLEILAAWHQEPANQGLPVVILIESAESFKSDTLADLIVALSEWIGKIPVFLVMGLATTADSLRKSLPASSLERLKSWKFSLKSPSERLEAVINDALVSTFCGFEIGHSVAAFMEAYFTAHDLTVSFLLRSLKVACIEHFSREPLSFLCSQLFNASSKAEFEADCLNLPNVLLEYASTFQSVLSRDADMDGRNISGKEIAMLLWELKEQKKRWCMALQCLHQAARQAGYPLLSLFCRALNPSTDQFSDLVSTVRNLPHTRLSDLLDEWKTLTRHVKDLDLELIALKCKLVGVVTCEPKDARPAVNPQATMNKRQLKTLQLSMVQQMNLASQNSKAKSVGILAAEFLQQIVEKYLVPLETLPLHEVVCFKKEQLVKQALSGEIRQKVHFDLAHPQTGLECECCPPGTSYCPTSPDACLGFCLAEEHADHINVHDWYQSFASVLSSCDSLGSSPPKKKRGRPLKHVASVTPVGKAIIQARFSKAAAELQLLGLVRFPRKKRPDFVHRAAFGF